MSDISRNTSRSISPCKRSHHNYKNKRKLKEDHEDGMATVIKKVIDLVEDQTSEDGPQNKNVKLSLEHQSIPELFSIITSHNEYLKLLQSNDICTEEDKQQIMGEIKKIYQLIRKKSSNNDKDNRNSIVS